MGVNVKYGISTYGKEFLIEEDFGEEGTPPLRHLFILINVILVVWTILAISVEYVTLRRNIEEGKGARGRKRQDGKGALGTVTSVFIAFMVNNALRSSHMIDHICRPVYYHEPRWAHAKIWITEMEIPTYAAVILSPVAVQGMKRFMSLIHSGNKSELPGTLIFMAVYIFGSLFNLVHYTIEPPQNYGPFPNFNIAGTGLTNLPIIFLLIKVCWGLRKSKSSKGSSSQEQLLNENKRVTRSSTGRRRSKTPTKK